MAKKRGAGKSGGVMGAERAAAEAAKKIGELQSQLRLEQKRLDRSLKTVKKQMEKEEARNKLVLKRKGKTRDTYDTRESTTLFVGGRKENSLAENADDPFTAEDLMLSRKAVVDKTAAAALYHKRGAKKGQVKFRGWHGGWKSRNTEKLKKYKGKEITLKISYEKNKQGRTTTHSTERKITYKDYDSLIAAYRDAFRADVIEIDSDASYGVTFVEFVPPPEPPKAKNKAKRSTKRGAKRKAVKRKGAKKARGKRGKKRTSVASSSNVRRKRKRKHSR